MTGGTCEQTGQHGDGLAVVHARRPTLEYYRFLYDAVGRPWHWDGRKKLSDEELARIIHDPADEVHVLYAEGVPVGFAELDRRLATVTGRLVLFHHSPARSDDALDDIAAWAPTLTTSSLQVEVGREGAELGVP